MTPKSRRLTALLMTWTLIGASVMSGCVRGPLGGPAGQTNGPTVSGFIRTSEGQSVTGVVVSSDATSATTGVTNADGYYSVFVPYSWSGRLTPRRSGYEFDPSVMELQSVTADVVNSDFTARLTPGANPAGYPRADAGADQCVEDDDGDGYASVALDGSRSRDPNGTIASYAWTEDGNVLAREAAPTLRVPLGMHVLRLLITDDSGERDDDLVVVIIVPKGEANVLFVAVNDPAASDGNAGTRASPLKTIGRAAQMARPGQTILLRAGTYNEQFVKFANSGTESAPITVKGYSGEEVIVTSGSTAKWVFDFTDEHGAEMNGFGYYAFRNFKVKSSRHIWRFAFAGDGSRLKPHHITIEDVEGWDCGSVLTARNSGVEYITVRRCNFHDCWGTEGTLDFSHNADQLDVPHAASHDILVEDCDFHDNHGTQQINGIVTQGQIYNVTLRRCRSWNNGKYGFALKGSGNFVVDRCAAWANGSSQFYLRGMIATDPPDRTATAANDCLLTNCIAVGARNAGGTIIIWREGANIRLYNCTFVTLHDTTLTKNGDPFATSERQTPPILPVRADVRNCVFLSSEGGCVGFFQGNGLGYLQQRRYEADHNLFYNFGPANDTNFKYQSQNWLTLAQWQAYWARGEPGGDDQLKGPTATHADAHSIWADPSFLFMQHAVDQVPLNREWPDDFRAILDPAPRGGSPLFGNGENLIRFNLPQLGQDFYGDPRPANGSWTIGAIQLPPP